MTWDEVDFLRKQLERVTEERDRYEQLYMRLFGLLLHSDKNLRWILFNGEGTLDLVDESDPVEDN